VTLTDSDDDGGDSDGGGGGGGDGGGCRYQVLLGEWLVPAPAPTPNNTRCGLVAEGKALVLGCPTGQTIDRVTFASFGMPDLAGSKSCGCAAGFKEGVCPRTGKIVSSNNSLRVLETFCMGKTTCAVPADQAIFADDPEAPPPHDPCKGPKKALAAEVHCSGDPPGATSSCKGHCYNQPFVMPPWPNPQAGGTEAMYPQISGGDVQQYENHVLRAGNHEPLSTLLCAQHFSTQKPGTLLWGTLTGICLCHNRCCHQ
jgi:hypothetical protein